VGEITHRRVDIQYRNIQRARKREKVENQRSSHLESENGCMSQDAPETRVTSLLCSSRKETHPHHIS